MNTAPFVDEYQLSLFKESEKTMNPKWKSIYKDLPLCELYIANNQIDSNYLISGTLKNHLLALSNYEPLVLKYYAANSPTYNGSFTGSGLPYPNESVAFEKSENVGQVDIHEGKFLFKIRFPNSYYKNLGTILVQPEVRIRLCSKTRGTPVSDIQVVRLGESIPFRTLDYPNQRNFLNGPFFYDNTQMPAVRSQYQILIDSAYPSQNIQPPNFWGTTPPN